MRVADVMSKPAISVAKDDLLSDVIPNMVRNHISGLPVVDGNGALVGILSEGDLLRRIELGTSQSNEGFWTRLFTAPSDAVRYRRVNGHRVRDVMTDNVVTVEATDTLADAARLMQQFKVKRLPVMSEGALVGMLSRADFVKALGRFLAPTYDDTTVSDDEIISKIRQEIDNQQWSGNCTVRLSCRNGEVTVSGCAPTENQRKAIVVAAEATDGVRSVINEIAVYEPLPVVGM
jgi:CBS domain-containing protein